MKKKARAAAVRQLLGLAKPKSTDPAQEVVGRWRIEDCITGDTGITLALQENGQCRVSNGVKGTWAIEGEQLVIKALPFAAFFVTPGGDEMLGAWMLIEGEQGTASSVALHRMK